jgi:hypothetical protein
VVIESLDDLIAEETNRYPFFRRGVGVTTTAINFALGSRLTREEVVFVI